MYGQYARVELRKTPDMGMGVFALEPIGVGDLIEVAPAIHLTDKEAEHLVETPLNDYYFHHELEGGSLIVLGNGGMYNHKYPGTNVDWFTLGKNAMVYWAMEPIKVGDQLFIDYGESYWEGVEHEKR